MADISKIDKNFAVSASCGHDDVVFRPAGTPPFRMHGLLPGDGDWLRIPAQVAAALNPGLAYLNQHTAGGRLRFITDSPYVAIRVTLRAADPMPHMARTGYAGFDVYARQGEGEHYRGTLIPDMTRDTYEAAVNLPGGLCTVTLNFPLYAGIHTLEVGLAAGAAVEAPEDYRYSLPVVYYGSSITQGGCASRPGNSYQSILSRRLSCDFVNLGFSGSCKAEPVMADYLKTLPMSVFVCDYDHNAPDADFLRATHSPLYHRIREARPDLPILFISAPLGAPDKWWAARRDVVEATYREAVAAGDTHVAFIDGGTFAAALGGDSITVDGCHPNDLGFWAMANGIEPVLRRLLEG